MTNIEYLIDRMEDYLCSAKRDHHKTHDNLAKRQLETVKGLVEEATECLENDAIINVCQWCGDESEEDHPCAICVKG